MEKIQACLGNDGVPVLETPQGYLSYFRDYRVQMSRCADGTAEICSSEASLHWLMHLCTIYFKSEYRMVAFAASTLQAVSRSPLPLEELFPKHKEELIKFLQMTADEIYDNSAPFKAFDEVVVKELSADEIQFGESLQQADTCKGNIADNEFWFAEFGPDSLPLSCCTVTMDKITLWDFINSKEISWEHAHIFKTNDRASLFMARVQRKEPEEYELLLQIVNFLGWFVDKPAEAQEYVPLISRLGYTSDVVIMGSTFNAPRSQDSQQQPDAKTNLFN